MLAIAALVVAAAVPGLWRLEVRTDGAALVPSGAPEVLADRAIRERFDLRDPLAVVVTSDHPEGLFVPATLRRVRDLSVALGALDGLRPWDVTSLATEPGFRHRPGSLRFRTLLEVLPETPEQIAQLRADLDRIELYTGTLISADGLSVDGPSANGVAADGRSAAILIATPPAVDRAAWVAEVRRIVDSIPGDERVSVVGAPVAESSLGHHILADLGLPHGWLGSDETIGSTRGRLGNVGMVPAAVVVMASIFWLVFRRWPAVLLPLSEIGACLVVVGGVMGWLGVPITLTTVVLPVILAAVGTADEIHVFRRYLDLAADGGAEPREVVRRTLDEMTSPVVRTSMTTAVAFLAFAFSPLGPVRGFGVLAAFGVLLCMLYTLTVVPALLVVGGPAAWQARDRSVRGAGGWRGVASWWIAWTSRRSTSVLVATAVLVLIGFDGVRRLEVQDSWAGGFDPASAFARDTREFDRRFLGAHLLRVVVEGEAPAWQGEIPAAALGDHELTLDATVVATHTDAPEHLIGAELRIHQLDRPEPREWTTSVEAVRRDGDRLIVTLPRQRGSARFWLRPTADETLGYAIRSEPFTVPTTLERVAALEAFLDRQPGVGGVLGPARYLATARFMQTAATTPDDQARRLPETPREARHLWSNVARLRGEERLRQWLDDDRRAAVVTAYLEGSDHIGTRRLLAALDAYAAEHLTPHGLRLGLAGDVAVSQALIDGVVDTQRRSLGIALLGIVLITACFGGIGRAAAWRRGLLVVAPPTLAIGACIAAMGWTRVPLGVATSMFAGMTLGVGVDFAIHFLARYERVRERGGRGQTALVEALAISGPAILIDALAVGLGFGVLALSNVPSTARLGGLAMVGIAGCVVATWVVLPAILARSEPGVEIG